MKVSLIVVQGKPEGKVIPLSAPVFRIGRGEGCHLRPNNEQVSRNHSEVAVDGDTVVVRDLGSRNGTFVNNTRVEPNGTLVVKNKDLIQIGPLTFAVSIQGAPTAAATPASVDKAERAMAKAASLDEMSHEDIDAWLVTDKDSPAPERPSGVYTGDTMTFDSYQGGSKSDHEIKAQRPATPEPEPEDQPEPEDEPAEEAEGEEEDIYDKLEDEGDAEGGGEEFIDESNPFYMAKKQAESDAPAASVSKKGMDQNSSQAAEDILRKMMERRRAAR